ncbi:hypothetical protein DL96DRAFT_1458035 [Flagelloscypha sp. PMI_526]|nr:hypothetical protein DL96DRAFT_1458035 [Flagelloscypha sp. PMI_526]
MPSTEKPSHLLNVGTACSLNSCHLVDFLPFKCQHCTSLYCAEHFHPVKHDCTRFNPLTDDRIAPNCPACNEPVAIPPDEDPNLRMDSHLADCSVITGKVTKKPTRPTCAKKRCTKSLISPIFCTSCGHNFCVSHRFPKDHDCVSTISDPNHSGPSNASLNQLRLQRFEALAKPKPKPQPAKAPTKPKAGPKKTHASAPKPSPVIVDLTVDEYSPSQDHALSSLQAIFPNFDTTIL